MNFLHERAHSFALSCAFRRGINTVTVVNNNHCLNQCLKGINIAYGDTPGNKDDMYMFRDVNFARIAQEIGCVGIRVERPEEIRAALETALAAETSAVVDVVTDPEHQAPWPPSPTFRE
jgi:acetolactate synthase-1/2/3 large subunit